MTDPIVLRDCDHRQDDGSCNLVTEQLGWPDRVVVHLCPQCDGTHCEPMREHVQRVQLKVKGRGLWVYDDEVVRAVAPSLSPSEKHDTVLKAVGRVPKAKVLRMARACGVPEELVEEKHSMLLPEDAARAEVVKCGEDVAEPGGIRFNVNTGGMGDMVAMMWHAQWMKENGVPVSFYCTYPTWAELLRSAGFEVVETGPPGLACGGAFKGWAVEREQTQGRISRLGVWGSSIWNRSKIGYKRPRVMLPSGVRRWAKCERRAIAPDKPLVLLFPFARWGAREWPTAYFVDLAWALEKQGYATAALCAADEKPRTEEFPYRYYGLSLMQLLAFISEADLVIGNDSGGMHLCGLTQTKGVALCGPVNNVYRDYGNILEVMVDEQDAPCVGCFFQPTIRGVGAYRRACNMQCRALMMLEPERVMELIVGAEDVKARTQRPHVGDAAAECVGDAAESKNCA